MEKITRYSTLFLDRDGVINQHRPHDYVKSADELVFIPGSLEAVGLLSPFFSRILVVTNQRGVGKGVMTLDALTAIHHEMTHQIEQHGGRIDRIYFCTDLSDSSLNRKPNPGMAIHAQQDFPEIIWKESIMVGDSASDLQFARNTGMRGVWIHSQEKKSDIPSELYDEQYPNLLTFALNYIKEIRS